METARLIFFFFTLRYLHRVCRDLVTSLLFSTHTQQLFQEKNEVNLIVGMSKSESWCACIGLNQHLSATAQTKKMLQIPGAHSATLL